MPFSAVLAAALQPLVGGEQIQRRKHCVILFVYIPCGKRKSCPMLFIYICHGVFYIFVESFAEGRAAYLSHGFRKYFRGCSGDFRDEYLCFGKTEAHASQHKIHKEKRRFYICVSAQRKIAVWAAKSPIDSGFSQETSILSPHSGGVGETRTLAPGFSRPTPLAGAPRHQLEYNSIGTSCQGVQLNLGGGESGIRTHGPLRDHWFSRPAP